MREPTYEQALSKGWQMVWHHKSLWVLGLFAAFLGQFGLGDFLGRLWFLFQKGSISVFSEYSFLNLGFSTTSSLTWYNILGIIWLVGLLILIVIAVVFVAVTAQGALIYYSAAWYKSNKFNSFKKAWQVSVKRFWSMFLIVMVYKALFCLLIFASSYLLEYSVIITSDLVQLLLGVVMGVVLFFYLLFSIIYIYALAYVVIDNQKVVAAATKAWALFSRHILVSFEVGLILMILNLILVIIGAILLIMALVPATAFWVAAGILNIGSLTVFGFLVGLFTWLVLIVLAGSVFNAFNISVWTYLFIKMHNEGIISRVIHHIGKIFKR